MINRSNGVACVVTGVSVCSFPTASDAQRFRSEKEARKALPEEWRTVKHLPNGFPSDFQPELAASAPDGKGGRIEFGERPSAERLAGLRKRAEEGFLLDYYFLPREERYRKGPGVTGDEVLSDIRNDKFPKDCKHVNFIYGFYVENVRRYYILYRVSGDPYYVDQIVKYAEGIQWFLDNRPEQLLPAERRDTPPADPVAEIPHEPAAVANFFPHVNAARLLLEEAKKDGVGAKDPRVVKAKAFLLTAMKWMDSQIKGLFPKTFDRPRGNKPAPTFVAGKTTTELVEKYQLPPRAAFVIEYIPWNQTFFYFATLAAASRALNDLGEIERTDKYQKDAELYTRICQVAMMLFQRESDCVIKDGSPYIFHRHTPLRDGDNKFLLGHPMFGAEDTAHSQSGAINLPYLWEAGAEFGCTDALLAGYANAMLHTMDDPSAKHRNGKDWPRAHIDSPWYLAVTGRKDGPAPRLGQMYFGLLAFTPKLVQVNRRYMHTDRGRGNLSELLFLYAGHIYREAMARRKG